MGKIIEQTIDGEKVYMKKNQLLGWAVVNPIVIEGKINWRNLLMGGNWVKFFIMIFLLLILFGSLMEYASVIKIAEECLANKMIFKL